MLEVRTEKMRITIVQSGHLFSLTLLAERKQVRRNISQLLAIEIPREDTELVSPEDKQGSLV